MKNFKKTSIPTVLILFSLILIACSLSTVSAANQTINDTSAGGILGGIGNASAGDTVFLQPGTYNKTGNDTNFTISKNITIQGNGSKDSVIIDAQGLSRIFTMGNNLNLTFINITFINGNFTGNGGVIYNNYAGTTMAFINCTFANHTTTGTAGAIYSGGNLTLINSTFNGNKAASSPSFRSTGDNLTIMGCNFTNEYSSGNTGSFIVTDNGIVSYVYIVNSIFSNCSGNNGGVIYVASNNDITIINSTFTNSTARGNGGVILCSGGNITLNITNSSFINNKADNNGGAIYFAESAAASGFTQNNSFILNNCNFIDNSATNGGATFINSELDVKINSEIYNSTFTNNTATNYGGSIFNGGNMLVSGNTMNSNSAGLGQMIYNTGFMGILNLTFIDNSTWVVKNGSTITLYATLTDDMGNTVTAQNISFYLNGVFFENVTSIEGKANMSYTVPSSPGDIPVSGEYAGIGAFNILINNGLLKVKIPTKITISVPEKVKVGDKVTLESKLTDENGNPIAGATIDFYVDGVKVGSATTDSNGIAKLNYTFNKAGKPKVEAKYAGNDTYFASNATNQTTVSKIPTITTVETDKNTITATLTDEDGTPLVNKKVTITVNGKTYTKTTNSQGQVIIKYKNAWDYKVTANFAGDEKYLASKATAPKRTPTKITIEVDGDKITATLTDENGTPLKGKKIVFRVKGVVIGVGITNAEGKATIYYKDAYKYRISASFEGDEEYGPSTAEYTPENPKNISGTATMKQTGLPIVSVLVCLLAIFGLVGYRKRE